MTAFTLRLADDDHRLLRLYCAATGQSQAAVITNLLRTHLDQVMPGQRDNLARDPGALQRALGVQLPNDPRADDWAKNVVDDLRDDTAAA